MFSGFGLGGRGRGGEGDDDGWGLIGLLEEMTHLLTNPAAIFQALEDQTYSPTGGSLRDQILKPGAVLEKEGLSPSQEAHIILSPSLNVFGNLPGEVQEQHRRHYRRLSSYLGEQEFLRRGSLLTPRRAGPFVEFGFPEQIFPPSSSSSSGFHSTSSTTSVRAGPEGFERIKTVRHPDGTQEVTTTRQAEGKTFQIRKVIHPDGTEEILQQTSH